MFMISTKNIMIHAAKFENNKQSDVQLYNDGVVPHSSFPILANIYTV